MRKNFFAFGLLLVLVFVAVGCQSTLSEPQPTASPQETHIPISQFATTTKSPSRTRTPLAEVTSTPQAAAEAQPTTILGGSPEPATTPPTLFPGSWEDRVIFAKGLVPEEVDILQELPGATVYHMKIDISNPRVITGVMETYYTNQETVPLQELVLHLFPGSLGGDIALSNIRLDGNMAESAVDDGTIRVMLDQPLNPGDHTVLSLDFTTSVPGEESTKYKVLAYDENILALAHFYPMFAVFNEQGWHTEPTANHGDETFADMSFFQVEIAAPTDQVIVASGIEVERGEANGRQLVTYAAGPVRDFYLASSNSFDVVQRQVGPVLVSSYAPPELSEGAELALDVAARSLQSFTKRYGSYPYSELDIVATPTEALGIEYPGIFANAIRIYDLPSNSSNGLPNTVLLESTTVHEAAHQWFYNLVGSDQLNEPWLDEALAQYATWQYYIDSYGEQSAQGFYSSLEGRWQRAEDPNLPIGLPADAYSSRDYGAIVYGRGPIFLHELAERMGQETFDDFLRDYSEEYRWQIAYGEDFMHLAEEHCNCDLSQLFAEEVFGN